MITTVSNIEFRSLASFVWVLESNYSTNSSCKCGGCFWSKRRIRWENLSKFRITANYTVPLCPLGPLSRKYSSLGLLYCIFTFWLDKKPTIKDLRQGRHLRGAGGPSPPRKKKKRKRKKKQEKKEKREKNKKKKKERKKGTMNNVKLLHIKCFFSNFSIVRWHWKMKKFWPLQEKVEMTPLSSDVDNLSENVYYHVKIYVNKAGRVATQTFSWKCYSDFIIFGLSIFQSFFRFSK